jgi:hypothetical protein
MLQVVLVSWGTRYEAGYVNGLARAIASHSSVPLRFYLVTDRTEGPYDPNIAVRPFPDFGMPFETATKGCGAKLAMFAPGVTDDPNCRTLFFDLDTLVRGDVAKLAAACAEAERIYMLPNHYLPLWRVDWLTRRLAPDYYYFANSSIMVFTPARFHEVFHDFCIARRGMRASNEKRLASDERFLSWWARGRVSVISKRLAVRFSHEFMAPWLFVSEFKKRLPWITRRREGLVAVTFSGREIKPSIIVGFRQGELVRAYEHKAIWAFADYQDYFRNYPVTNL